MAIVNPFADSLLSLSQEQKSIVVHDAQRIRSEYEKAEKIKKFWEEMDGLLHRGWTLHILAIIQKESALLEELKNINHPSITALEEINKVAKENAEKIKFYLFPNELDKAFNQASLRLDRNSAHPNYKFEGGFFELHINEQKRTARLSNYENQKLFEIAADIEAIVEACQREHKRVFDRQFDNKKFLKKLRKIYQAILKEDKLRDGSSVAIRRITTRLGKNEKGFRTDEFLIELSHLVSQEQLEIDGRKLDCQQIKDIDRGMFLHIEPKRYIGSILFKGN
ncbi:hypothetical protein VB774_03790 [Pseudanabaena galeata UHCC 0370]|uniref:Uncharacterized protein n=1 Tax=Pseudanabaena galeata UHCC 0370 TaxID=3110310 RepID=A0ABU5TF13_9CYAN|nr:hypothetical protein [Pseudanabaena galeata]MEA5476734.1 hypothetical protein [Pseudanabaena galeata UHCC 0370]